MDQHVKKTMVRGKLICWMTTHEGSSQVQDGFQVRGSRQPIAVNVDLVIHLANGQRSSLEVDGDGPLVFEHLHHRGPSLWAVSVGFRSLKRKKSS